MKAPATKVSSPAISLPPKPLPPKAPAMKAEVRPSEQSPKAWTAPAEGTLPPFGGSSSFLPTIVSYLLLIYEFLSAITTTVLTIQKMLYFQKNKKTVPPQVCMLLFTCVGWIWTLAWRVMWQQTLMREHLIRLWILRRMMGLWIDRIFTMMHWCWNFYKQAKYRA